MKFSRKMRMLSLFLAMLMLFYGSIPTQAYALSTEDIQNVQEETVTEATEATEATIAESEAEATTEPETETEAATEPEQSTEETEAPEENLLPVYEDGAILIYTYVQLLQVGTGASLTNQDAQADTLGQGEIVLDENGDSVTYSLDGSYRLAQDIPLPEGTVWQLPEDFAGRIAPAETLEEKPLYDAGTDTIYVYHRYQLAVMSYAFEDAEEPQPVMTGDSAVDTFGMGQLIYASQEDESANSYLTYSPSHNYVLSAQFCSDIPENGIMTVAEGDPEGRDFAGQVVKTIDGTQYILIGNEQQLRAIGSDTKVITAIYNSGKEQIYPGDADLEAGQKLNNGDTIYGSGLSAVIDQRKYGVKQGTGELDKKGTFSNTTPWDTGLTYASNANYIIFRDIDLGGFDSSGNAIESKKWTPIMFSGQMVGAITDGTSTLWNAESTEITKTRQPIISNVYVHQTAELEVNEYIGIGFFATISNEINTSNVGISAGTVHVTNLELNNVTVDTATSDTKSTATILSTLTSSLGWLVGGLVDLLVGVLTFGSVELTLKDTLFALLNARADNPTRFATGSFAGRVVGDVSVTDCQVSGTVRVTNQNDYTGGFVGYTEGVTQYDGLSTALGITVDALSSLLNAIPGLGLGDLITILLKNALPLDSLIPTGYINPTITDCSVSGLTGTVGHTDASYNCVGGFAGAQVGTWIENCQIKNSTYTVKAANYGGGFTGLERDADIQGLLKELGVELLQVLQPQSLLWNCSITDSAVIVDGGSYQGGFVGAMAMSYGVHCSLAGSSLAVKASGSYAGGYAGFAGTGWVTSLGKNDKTDSSLLSTVSDLVVGLLSGTDDTDTSGLLSLVGVQPSAILGCQIEFGSVTVSAGADYAGGLVGWGGGLKLMDDTADTLNDLPLWKYGMRTVPAGWNSWSCKLSGLQSVSAGGSYAGGVAGLLSTASAAGLVDSTLGLVNLVGFTAENIAVTGVEGGYTVSAGENFAGGGFGMTMGGEITNVTLDALQSVTAKNQAGGFAGCAGPGDLAGAGGINLSLLGLDLLSVNKLLSVGQGVEVKIKDSTVTGISDGYTVTATGTTADSNVSKFTAAGFIAKSNSTDIQNSHAYNLKEVKATDESGYAGGFIGTSETGGLAEVSDAESLKLIGVDNLLGAVGYLIPSYTDCTVHYVNGGGVQADVAGGFVADLQSGTVNNEVWSSTQDSDGNANGAYSVYNIDYVKGQTYGGGFGGKIYSGALADAGGGISILGDSGLNINISDLLNVIEAYVPYVSYAGVYSENGFTVEAKALRDGDSTSGIAGGFAGYLSGAQISSSDVNRLKHTNVTPPEDLEAVEASSYFDGSSSYAVTGGRYAGGYVGDMDIGSAASVGNGLNVLGESIQLTDLLSALSVVVSTIEHSDVYGGAGGYAILSTATDTNGKVGMSGGYAGRIAGGHIQDSNAHNFSYIIGEISAGGYVGSMLSGDVASVLGEGGILKKLVNVDSLVSLVEDFVPTIRNSSTDCIPCGGAVRAHSASDSVVQRGMAGGYVGHNEGGHIWGLNTKPWKAATEAYTGPTSLCKAIRIRSVYGYEYAGGYTGYMECADTASGGSLSLLGGLISEGNLLSALSVVYPTQENTEVSGPLADLDVDTWNSWVTYVGKYGGYGAELAKNGTVSTQEELNGKLAGYTYGYHVAAGRGAYEGNLPTEGGDAGGYVGRMSSGVITNALAKDAKLVRAAGSAGGFAGRMLTGGLANFGAVSILGLNLNIGQLINLGEVLVPAIKSGSVQGYRAGLTVTATGNDLTHRFGYAGGYAGSVYGGQIWGDEGNANGCNVTKLRRVQGDLAAGGYVGLASAASVAQVNTNASSGLLQGLLDSLIGNVDDLASVLDATMTTIRKAEVSAADADWGFVVEGYSRDYATCAGGFAGSLEAAVLGKEDGASKLTVNGLRSVDGGLYAGGFFGLADVGSVADVSGTTGEEGGSTTTSILDLIKLGNVSVLDAFRTYIYHADVTGVLEGVTVTAHSEAKEGVMDSTRYYGCAGGFGGGMMNGSIHNSTMTNLNTVTAPNYSGGFVGHLGKNGGVDVDSASVLGDLLGATAGVLDIFGAHVEDCSLTGIPQGYLVKATGGTEPIAGGFAGLADLSRILSCTADKAKQITSDQIAGGFVGKATMAYLASAEVSSDLVNVVLYIVNELIKALYLPEAERANVLNINLGGLSQLKILSDGDLLYVNLLGLKISVALSKASETGAETDVAIVTIGDSEIRLKCNENGILDGEDTSAIEINLIKANRTKVEGCTVTGIDKGYDVYGGGAGNDEDGTHEKGYAGGFVGYNNEGRFLNNKMVYCDVIRGTAEKVGPFSGTTSLKSVYDFNTVASIEGENNQYSVYRVTEMDTAKLKDGAQVGGTAVSDTGTSVTYNRFDVIHLQEVQTFDQWKDAVMTNGTATQDIDAYVTSAQAVLMRSTPTRDNDESLVPEPAEGEDPCKTTIDLTIQKVWKDWNNWDKLRPDSITVRIIQHYTDAEGMVHDVPYAVEDADAEGWFTLEKQPGQSGTAAWSWVIEKLPVAYQAGENIIYYSYSVEEKSVDGYATTISYDSTGFVATITNTHQPELPFTGGIGDWWYVAVGLGLLLVVLATRKRRRDSGGKGVPKPN
jgi:LPXTG-motif cell wall-anchored protein